MRNVTPEQVAMAEQHRRDELPDRIEGALGELAGAAKEGLMALSVGVGLGVLHELMAGDMPGVTYTVPWAVIGLVAAIAYVASLLTTFLPARQASKVYPAEALRYE